MTNIREILDHAAGEQAAYIRGVHQALVFAYRMTMRAKTLEEAREIVGLMEDEAESCRGKGEIGYSVLDDISREAYRKLNEKA